MSADPAAPAPAAAVAGRSTGKRGPKGRAGAREEEESSLPLAFIGAAGGCPHGLACRRSCDEAAGPPPMRAAALTVSCMVGAPRGVAACSRSALESGEAALTFCAPFVGHGGRFRARPLRRRRRAAERARGVDFRALARRGRRSAAAEPRNLLHGVRNRVNNGINTALDVVHDAADGRVVDDVLDGSDSPGNRLVDGVADSDNVSSTSDFASSTTSPTPSSVSSTASVASSTTSPTTPSPFPSPRRPSSGRRRRPHRRRAGRRGDHRRRSPETAAMSSASAGSRPACAMSTPATRAKIAATVATLAFSDTATSLEVPTCAGRYTTQ